MNRSTAARRDGRRPVRVAGWCAAAATVLVVYVAVVLGGGALLGRTDSPSLGLSVLATAVVAAVAPRVQAHVEAERSRRLGDAGPSPYDVLADFSRVAGSEVAENAPGVIARMLVQSLALEWAQVWVLVAGELRLLAIHPSTLTVDEVAPGLNEGRTPDGIQSVTVAHAGRPLGVLRVKAPAGPLTPTGDRLLGGLAAQAGMVLESAQLREELAVRLRELTAMEHDLRLARGALVTAQGVERRRLERDIHDGAQQQLVALAINLKVAAAHTGSDPNLAREILRQQLAATDEAIRTLSDLSEGLLPRALADAGVAEALVRATAANPVPVRVHGGLPKMPASVEAALYFSALEAVQNATKHAGSTQIDVALDADVSGVSVTIEDDGSGIAPGPHQGSGLTNLRERATSVGGRLELGTGRGGGARVVVDIPRPRSTPSLPRRPDEDT